MKKHDDNYTHTHTNAVADTNNTKRKLVEVEQTHTHTYKSLEYVCTHIRERESTYTIDNGRAHKKSPTQGVQLDHSTAISFFLLLSSLPYLRFTGVAMTFAHLHTHTAMRAARTLTHTHVYAIEKRHDFQVEKRT